MSKREASQASCACWPIGAVIVRADYTPCHLVKTLQNATAARTATIAKVRAAAMKLRCGFNVGQRLLEAVVPAQRTTVRA